MIKSSVKMGRLTIAQRLLGREKIISDEVAFQHKRGLPFAKVTLAMVGYRVEIRHTDDAEMFARLSFAHAQGMKKLTRFLGSRREAERAIVIVEGIKR